MKNLQFYLGTVTFIGTHVAVVCASIFGLSEEIEVILPSALVLLFLVYLLISRKSRVDSDASLLGLLRGFTQNSSLKEKESIDSRNYAVHEAKIVTVSVEGANQEQIQRIKEEFDHYDEEHKVRMVDVEHFLFRPESNKDSELQRLRKKLKDIRPDALIIHRTAESEVVNWVYDEIDLWAKKNSGVPCIVIEEMEESEKKSLDKEGKYSDVLHDYLHHDLKSIPLKAIPWNLLAHAEARSSSWFVQARFNRITSLFTFGILTLGFVYAVFMINDKSDELKGSDNKPIENNQSTKNCETVVHGEPAIREIWNSETHNRFIWFNAQYATAKTGHKKSHFDLIKSGVKFELILLQPPRDRVEDFRNFEKKFEDMKRFVSSIKRQIDQSRLGLDIDDVFPRIIIVPADGKPSISFFYTDKVPSGNEQRAIIYIEDDEFMADRTPDVSIETTDKEVLNGLNNKYLNAKRHPDKNRIAASKLLDSRYKITDFYLSD